MNIDSVYSVDHIEGRQITGSSNQDKILRVMRHQYPDATVVLTLGKKRVMLQKDDLVLTQCSFETVVADTTAAGA